MAIDLIDACQREIAESTTRINELMQLYDSNQINNTQTVELGQVVTRKFFAQLELNKLNKERNRRNQAAAAGSD